MIAGKIQHLIEHILVFNIDLGVEVNTIWIMNSKYIDKEKF